MRTIIAYPIASSSGVQSVGQSPTLEIFHTATYTTSEQTSVTFLSVADRAGFDNGDLIYVGSGSSVSEATVSSGGGNTGAGRLTLSSAISYSEFDTVILKAQGATPTTEEYATVWDDPDHSNSITQPITADATNEVKLYTLPGRYGLRWADSDGNTLDIDHDVVFDELDWVAPTPGHLSTTAGIQEAYNKLPSGGGKVYIPPGTYSITGTVGVTTSNVTFQGAGRGRTVLQFNAAAASRMFNVSTSGLSDITFRDIEFDGNGANATSALQFLRFNDTSNVLVENCYFRDAVDIMAWHDYTTTAPENITYRNCEFTNWGDDGGTAQALLIEQSKFINIDGCYFHDAADAGSTSATVGSAIQIGGTAAGLAPCSYIRVANTVIDNVGTAGTGSARGIGVIGTTTNNCTHVTIVGNHVRFTEGDSISVANTRMFVIDGNTIVDSDESSIGCWSSKDGVISNNYVEGGEAGIGVQEGGALSSVSNVAVIGNTVVNNDSGAVNVNGAINVGNATNYAVNNIVVSGNVIWFDTTGMGSYGIRVIGHASNKVTNVIVANNNVENAKLDGILITQASNVSVYANHSVGNDAMGINVGSSTDVTVKDNVTLSNTTQGINDLGTNTRMKILWNKTGTTGDDTMDGTAKLNGASPAMTTVGTANPYMRADGTMKMAVGIAKPNTAPSSVYISSMSNGTVTIRGGNGQLSDIWWRIEEVGSTA